MEELQEVEMDYHVGNALGVHETGWAVRLEVEEVGQGQQINLQKELDWDRRLGVEGAGHKDIQQPVDEHRWEP